MAYEQIIYAVEEGIAILTLNRPDKLNAFTKVMTKEIIDALDRVDADDDVRAVIVTGAGRAFCAGADISGGASGFLAGDQGERPHQLGSVLDYAHESARDGGGLLTLRIFECLKPVIGAVNGAAVGIGATMLLPMDIRLASVDARFGFVFSRRGIVPEAASSFFLPRIVGISQALQWCYSGAIFSANEALAAGLVKSLHNSTDTLAAAIAIARDIADNAAPVSTALIRQMMWRGLGMSHPMEAHRVESRGVLSRSHSDDAAEGVAAFLEKRRARFPNRVSADMPDYFPWWSDPHYE